jgi:L,D-peptidoglycan transpeptidase YkuD (ErfK/YbiS/YcfS/YnhG family)
VRERAGAPILRSRAIILALAAAALVLALTAGTVMTAPVAAAAATTTAQVITVSAPTATSTSATVEAWARQADGRYRRVAAFTSARIGAQGLGPTNESLSRTPTGSFKINQPFGLKPNPGNTGVPYLKVDRNDVWTSSNGSVINQHRRCAPGTCPSTYGGGERLSNYPGSYDYGFFIGYNAPQPYGTGAVAGAGSAFFFHVKNSQATGGCVAVAATQMTWLLRWLKFQTGPIVSIGVGTAAYGPIPNRYI